MFNRKKKGQLGFTLIELLAVVAILGILAGVAVPRVMEALATARTRANEANITILQSAVERWGIENVTTGALREWNALIGLGAIDPVIDQAYAITATALAPYVGSIPTPPGTLLPYTIVIRLVGTRHVAVVINGTVGILYP